MTHDSEGITSNLVLSRYEPRLDVSWTLFVYVFIFRILNGIAMVTGAGKTASSFFNPDLLFLLLYF